MAARTYLHNGALSPYPFTDADQGGLPFPYSCVYALGVCAVPWFGEGTCIVATGVELSAEAVSVTLAWRDANGRGYRPMCTLTAAPGGGYGTSASPSSYSAWLCAGTVPPSAVGSFRGEWGLDPACVSFVVQEDVRQEAAELDKVNLDLAETVGLYTDGILAARIMDDTAKVPGVALPPHTRPVLLYLELANDVVTVSGGAGADEYQTVRSVNLLGVPSDGVLKLSSASPSGDESSSACNYVSFTVHRTRLDGIGIPLYSEMELSGEAEEELAERTGVRSGSVLVTIDGHKAIPNCYGQADGAKD
jgi:hypothetical protein